MHNIILSTGILRPALKSIPNYPVKIIELYGASPEIMEIIDGIEFNIRSFDVLEQIVLSEKSEKIVQSLSSNTMHFVYFEEISLKKLENYRDKIIEFHKVFRFQNVVLHPGTFKEHELPEILSYFKETVGIPLLSVENMIHTGNVSQYDFEFPFAYKAVCFLLDITHATMAEIDGHLYGFKYLQSFFEKVRYVHLSAVNQVETYYSSSGHAWNYKMHRSLTGSTPEEISLFEPAIFSVLDQSDTVGIVLETSQKDCNLEPIINDLKFIKETYVRRNDSK